MKIKQIMQSKRFLIGFVSFAMLIGSGYNTYLAYERFYNPDTVTYVNIAKGNFQGQSPVRKYRILVPFAADLVSKPIAAIYYKVVQDKRDRFDWPLLTGFFLVNSLLMSIASVFIFKIMVKQGLSNSGIVAGLAVFLAGGRWAGLVAAHPITDSLTILSISMMVFGLLSEDRWLLFWSIIMGLLSKESFVLFFPLILLFCKTAFLRFIIPAMLLATGLYFCIKYYVDKQSLNNAVQSVMVDLKTLENIGISARKLFSVKGIADVFSVYGFFNLFLLSGLFYKQFRTAIRKSFSPIFILFSVVILTHMLLSTELARMFYLGSAMFAPFLGRCIELHPVCASLSREQMKVTDEKSRIL